LSICETAVYKGALRIEVVGELLEDIKESTLTSSDKCRIKISPAFERVATRALNICATNSYYRAGRGGTSRLEDIFLFIDEDAARVLSHCSVKDLDTFAPIAVSKKALKVIVDGIRIRQAVEQHRAMKKTQAQIDHLVLAKAPTSMIRYFFPQESEKDITERRKVHGVYMKGQPKGLSDDTKINIYRLLGAYGDKREYEQCVKIASQLDIDYLQLWSFVGTHFGRDEGEKMQLFEHESTIDKLSCLQNREDKVLVIAGMLSCSPTQAESVC